MTRRVLFAALSVVLFAFLAGATLVSAGGCSGVRIGVDPWDRDLLARPSMQLDSNPARDGNDAHMYFSREAASGGRGFAGGGCGCN